MCIAMSGIFAQGKAKDDVTGEYKAEEEHGDKSVVVGDTGDTDGGAEQRPYGRKRVEASSEGTLELWLSFAQAEEREHAGDVHDERAEDRHGDDVGGKWLTADLDEAVAVDCGDTDDASS